MGGWLALVLLTGCGLFDPDDDALPPFEAQPLFDLTAPTRALAGPDGRIYASTLTGQLWILSLDESGRVSESERVTLFEGLENPAILGLAFDPFDTEEAVLYVAHSRLRAFHCRDEPWPFLGAVSRVRGPDFDTLEPVLTGLPCGRTTHGVNDLLFDDAGRLLISVGGMTNAGLPSCDLGGLPESPFSGAVLALDLGVASLPLDVIYLLPEDAPSQDQRFGDQLWPIDVEGLEIFAAGLRNAYGLETTLDGEIYAVDNGPDPGAGNAPNAIVAEHPDELNRLVEGGYYGHPNLARDGFDPRQSFYHSSLESSDGSFTQSRLRLPASTNGIVLYSSRAAGADLDGVLLLQQFDGITFAHRPGENRPAPRSIQHSLRGLDLSLLPGGRLLLCDFSGGQLRVARPTRVARMSAELHDAHPWRGTEGTTILLSGSGFDDTAELTLANRDVEVEFVNESTLRAQLPRIEGDEAEVVDLVLRVAERVFTRPFRWMPPRPND